MPFPIGSNDLRREQRIESGLPVRISVGSQISVQGQLRDLSLKSAFIIIKNNIFLSVNDEIGIAIQCSKKADDLIEGMACVSRIVPGEGFAVYFTKLDTASSDKLKNLIAE